MDPILEDFENDLNKIKAQLEFIELLRKFSSCIQDGTGLDDTPFYVEAKVIHDGTKRIHSNLPLASGTLILYTCGRFEAMARTLFEDLCQRLVSQAKNFARLPKKMRENLPVFTAKVISDPRKYGHAENGVRSFVSILASNLAPGATVDRVNHECLSITDANMKPDVLSELFARVGVGSIWTEISQQASLKRMFGESDASKVEAKARKRLTELMDLRNKIAHPSTDIEWPSIEILNDYVEFLRQLARSMVQLVEVYEVTLCQKEIASVQPELQPQNLPNPVTHNIA